MSEATIALMRERVVIPPEHEIQVFERKRTSEPPSEEFLPFKASPPGVPDFAPLGSGYHIIYSLNPHDERGRIDWDPDGFERLYKRVTGKIADNKRDICFTESFHLDDADISLIAYGSEVRPAIRAAEMARERGIKAGVLKLGTVWPVPDDRIREVAGEVKAVISVEMNMGKYAGEIERVVAGRCATLRAGKNRGSVHLPEELLPVIEEAAR